MNATVSPRSDADPMAFTGREFFRGAVSAWIWAMSLTTIVWTVCTGGIGIAVALPIVVPAASAATVLFAVLAWTLGRALRRVRRVGIHLLLFALLGALVGAATTAGYSLLDAGGLTGFAPMLYVVNVSCGAVAVALGWRSAASRALGWSEPLPRPASRSLADLSVGTDVVETAR
ncbi:MAG: hypothetical protein J0I43_07505 [Microbacterium sp.]|uniref:hypothetical protein n=1 Tax=Microbacterium sp. TaxID=51671 RepID=UPI001ACFF92C|nr:hypothetical protein [Microbacterium sp.]MBN9177197.1 hypothetical protein [Microbacterium sp.]